MAEYAHPRLKMTYPKRHALRLRVYQRSNFACAHCGMAVEQVPEGYDGSHALGVGPEGWRIAFTLELDHIVPRSLGGSNDESNLQALCRKCNRRKWAQAEAV